MSGAGVLENKLRWQSRRGALELDVVLEQFWRRADGLPEDELRALGELLALDDEDLRRAIKTGGGGMSPAAQKVAGVLRGL